MIYSIGFALQELEFKILNDIIWYKKNAPPNLSCRYFTHSTETVIWASKNHRSKHYFNYQLMKELNDNKQKRNLWNLNDEPESLWQITAPLKNEKIFGKHPTQKPEKLLELITLASTKEEDIVLDPFNGSGTSGVVSKKLKRRYIGVDFNNTYLDLTIKRILEKSNLKVSEHEQIK